MSVDIGDAPGGDATHPWSFPVKQLRWIEIVAAIQVKWVLEKTIIEVKFTRDPENQPPDAPIIDSLQRIAACFSAAAGPCEDALRTACKVCMKLQVLHRYVLPRTRRRSQNNSGCRELHQEILSTLT